MRDDAGMCGPTDEKIKLYGIICNLEGHEEHAQSISSRRHYQKRLDSLAIQNKLETI